MIYVIHNSDAVSFQDEENQLLNGEKLVLLLLRGCEAVFAIRIPVKFSTENFKLFYFKFDLLKVIEYTFPS